MPRTRTPDHHHHRIDTAQGTLVVDLPALVAAFSQRLHVAGLPVTPWQSEQYARSLGLVAPGSWDELYRITRAVFVTGVRQVPAFDGVFRDVFGSGDGGAAEDPQIPHAETSRLVSLAC
jgi:uncharacterized protein with von Willebrand factor type A (vWA) domain